MLVETWIGTCWRPLLRGQNLKLSDFIHRYRVQVSCGKLCGPICFALEGFYGPTWAGAFPSTCETYLDNEDRNCHGKCVVRIKRRGIVPCDPHGGRNFNLEGWMINDLYRNPTKDGFDDWLSLLQVLKTGFRERVRDVEGDRGNVMRAKKGIDSER